MLSQKLVLSAAGGAADPVYVDDVFSTHLYEGDGVAQTITNGIDLSGEGGLVWFKSRGNSYGWRMVDTERGATKALESYGTGAEATESNGLTAFTSTGFSVGTQSHYNGETSSTYDMLSYTFRKCPGFFDIVTYTGNGTAGRTVSHSLGSVPGAIWVKCTSHGNSWGCYHRSTGNTLALFLNSTGTGTTNGTPWNNTTPTSTEFTVGADGQYNATGRTYVAYIFAHDDQSFGENGDEAIIKCGTYTGTGSSGFPGNKITLGFEPQWLLIKAMDNSGTDWEILDSMRGMFPDLTNGSPFLRANLANGEFSNDARAIFLHADGFEIQGNNTSTNGSSGDDFLYIAIRRPHKPPTAGTDVFAIDQRTGNNPSFVANFPIDMAIKRTINISYSTQIVSRLIGRNFMMTTSGNAESDDPGFVWDYQNGWAEDGSANTAVYSWMFKRAKGFFDAVIYHGTGSTQNISHGLGVAPEMMWVKRRSGAVNWAVYFGDNTDYIVLNGNSNSVDNHELWNDTSPTASVFTVGPDNDVNANNNTYVAYLFATVAGISKVGTYTGTGSDLNIDCGFTNGARFVLIKRTSGSGDWWFVDSTRGYFSGVDNGLALNLTSQETTSYDLVDAYSAGFTAAGGFAPVNTSGETYLFLAIA